jgi:type IV pilus assembly protein PilW
MGRLRTCSQHGFTLPELFIAMAIGLIIAAAATSSFIVQRRSFSLQEEVGEMVQSARAAMDIMSREIRMAGYDPTEAGFDGVTPNYATVCGSLQAGPRLLADLRGANPDDPPDGAPDDGNEDITYCYDADNLQITRNTGGGNQEFADNVQNVTFTYLDKDGNPTAVAADVKTVQLTITTRTSKPDPKYTDNDGYRTYTLTSTIAIRNN